MRLGVVTFWQTADNFGQILQLYALQTLLKRLNHSPILIRTKMTNQICLKLKIKKFLNEFLFVQKLRCGGKFFSSFFKRYILYTKKIFKSKKDFDDADLNFDAVICGSDVVWSEGVGSGDFGELYFLDFVRKPIKKISYAASFGTTKLSKEFSNFVKNKISDFNAISVRECSGVDICSELGRRDAVSVCDPTMLLEKEDYESFFKTRCTKHEMFGYFIGWKTEIPEKEIREYAVKRKMKYSRLDCQNKKISLKRFFKRKSVSGWLETYFHSSCIFTNSFHGTIFAIIFNKPFLFFPLGNSAKKLNDRVENLLNKLNLRTRIWNPNIDLQVQMDEVIDWGNVNRLIGEWRKFSLNWLKSALES